MNHLRIGLCELIFHVTWRTLTVTWRVHLWIPTWILTSNLFINVLKKVLPLLLNSFHVSQPSLQTLEQKKVQMNNILMSGSINVHRWVFFFFFLRWVATNVHRWVWAQVEWKGMPTQNFVTNIVFFRSHSRHRCIQHFEWTRFQMNCHYLRLLMRRLTKIHERCCLRLVIIIILRKARVISKLDPTHDTVST